MKRNGHQASFIDSPWRKTSATHERGFACMHTSPPYLDSARCTRCYQTLREAALSKTSSIAGNKLLPTNQSASWIRQKRNWAAPNLGVCAWALGCRRWGWPSSIFQVHESAATDGPAPEIPRCAAAAAGPARAASGSDARSQAWAPVRSNDAKTQGDVSSPTCFPGSKASEPPSLCSMLRVRRPPSADGKADRGGEAWGEKKRNGD